MYVRFETNNGGRVLNQAAAQRSDAFFGIALVACVQRDGAGARMGGKAVELLT
jgi:poly(3-hydroxybutyrate) depolymerase